MAEGRTNVGIAALLDISEGATEKHISNIFGKLDLPDSENDHRRVLAVLAYLGSDAERGSRPDEGGAADRRLDRKRSVQRLQATRQPGKAAGRQKLGAARPVVPDLHDQAAILGVAADLAVLGGGVLGDVRERLGDHEVGGPLHRVRQPDSLRQGALHDGRHRAASRDRAQSSHQAPVEQDRRGDPANQVAQLRERLGA